MRPLACALIAALAGGDARTPAHYVGGTLAAFGRCAGSMDLTDARIFSFRGKSGDVEIPWDRINLIEYGQEVSRRYAAAILISPLLLMSKRRVHFLTVGFADDESRQHAMVFRVGKGRIRSVLAGLEARTGRKVQYQDEEARKAGKGS